MQRASLYEGKFFFHSATVENTVYYMFFTDSYSRAIRASMQKYVHKGGYTL